LESPGFYQQVTDFLEELVQMVWLQRVGKAFFFENGLDRFRREYWNQKKHPDPLRPRRVNFGVLWRIRLPLRQVPEGAENRPAHVRERNIDDHQAPSTGCDFRQGVRCQGHDSNVPSFGIEDVFKRALADDVVVDDQDSDFGHEDPAESLETVDSPTFEYMPRLAAGI
jgi:hypothetical protein